MRPLRYIFAIFCGLLLFDIPLLYADDPRQPATIHIADHMSFGNFIANGGGRLQLNPANGTLARQGSVEPTGGEQRGLLQISGEPDEAVDIIFGSNLVTLEHANPNHSMMVRLFRVAIGQHGTLLAAGTQPVILLDENGEAEFYFGASLYINPNQPEGTYTGHLNIQVAYE